MKIFLLTITILTYLTSFGQVIPSDRLVDWPEVVEHISIEQPNNQINILDFGAIGDGVTDNTQAINNAIQSLDGSLGYIYFPTGTYLITQTISLPDSCIIKGANSDETILKFDLGGEPINCISIAKSQSADYVEITGGINKGNNLISVASTDNFSVGDYVEIRQKNGSWDIAPISWADYSVGQICKIISISNNKLLISSKLRIDYSLDLDPEIRPIIPISNTGIQCIKITRIDEPVDGAGSNIYMSNAANCFVRGVESDKSVGAHVSINSSLNVLIDGSYFHHAFTYDGAGMRGYGVALSHHTSECLITNNIFRYLRHAMMIKTGSNGNIFSYNYSLEPHRSEPISDASGDISFHGHYPFSNLWEGNIVQNIVIDHYWGPSGPYNTLFRNRAELWGIIMTNNDLQETNTQSFVGNEVTNTEILHGMYTLTGEDHFEFGNNVLGNIIPTGTSQLPDESYYLSSKPSFWGQFLEWPSVGIPLDLGSGTIPSKIRYESGQNYTICPDSIITSLPNISNNDSHIRIWPVPAKDILVIELEDQLPNQIQIINYLGRAVIDIDNNLFGKKIEIPISHLPNGNYIIVLTSAIKSESHKFIIAR